MSRRRPMPIYFPEGALDLIDRAAADAGCSRSQYLVDAALMRAGGRLEQMSSRVRRKLAREINAFIEQQLRL